MSRTVKIGYADNFNSTGNPTTWAYPTSVTDPANNSSTVKYRYDTGANVWAQSPAPAGQSAGKTTERDYDSIGRLLRETIVNNGAYTRYEYPTNGMQSKVYATLVDVNSNGADAADEVLSESWTDGAGRIRMSRTEHPGSTGGWAATLAEYNILGQVTRQSVPTEVDNNWDPAGDDLTRGWIWNSQEYDWMGRTVRTVPADSNGSDGKDTLISYDGCGCAGGLVKTMEGPLMPRSDTVGEARRKVKTYDDILGRTFKTETFEWDGTTAYSTTLNTFNAADQVILNRQFAGNTSSTTFQDTMAVFDGHGRMTASHRTEQRDSNDDPAFTTYNYNDDNSLSSVTDSRGVITNYTYNSRGKVTLQSWNVGATGITDPGDIEYEYDDAGNRVSMTDALGEVEYEYNELSQMTKETREFTDITSRTFPINYTYQLGGQLKTLTDPNNRVVSNTHLKNGKLSSVNGSGFEMTVPFVSSVEYRAWGGVKEMVYGNGVKTNLEYNYRLQPASFALSEFNFAHTDGAEYEYNNDGSLKATTDLGNDIFDRAYIYDHAGRLKEALTGDEARGGTTEDGPYKQTFTYDVWGNTTQFIERKWTESPVTKNITVVNNRRTDYTYDSEARVLSANDAVFTYNAASVRSHFASTILASGTWGTEPVYENFTTHTGDKLPAKQETLRRADDLPEETTVRYYVTSSVLGGKAIGEFGTTGDWISSYIYADGMKVAVYRPRFFSTSPEIINWQHQDPVLGGTGTTGRVGEGGCCSSVDTFGNDVTTPPEEPFEEPPFIDPYSLPWWPLEIEGGPSAMFLEANAQWDAMMQDNRDRIRAEHYWATGRFEIATQIVAQNPNVGIEYRITGNINDFPSFFRNLVDSGNASGTIFGMEAAGFLNNLSSLIQTGFLVEQTNGGGGGGQGGTSQTGALAKTPNSKDISRCLGRLGKGLAFLDISTNEDTVIATIGQNGTTFSVVTHFTRRTARELGDIENMITGINIPNNNQSGYTTGTNPTNNDIAQEVSVGHSNSTFTTVGLVALYYHELGNAIAGKLYIDAYAQTRRDGTSTNSLQNPWKLKIKPTDQGDVDSGVKFERCLYKGIVNLRTGRVGNSRGF